jgi:hypothetical protein
VLSSTPAVGEKMASIVEEIGVGCQDSPIVPANARHAKIQAGQHLPHIGDLDVQKQLSQVCGADELGHTILTVTTGRPAPAAGPADQTQVLITSDDTPVGGYDAVITDPGGLFARRLGLEDGGRVVVRPDGYLGAITALDDSTGVADYFALIAR